MSHGRRTEKIFTDIQACIDEINVNARNNRLLPHHSKTKVVIFCKKNKFVPGEDLVELQIGGHKVDCSESYQYYSLHLKGLRRKINDGLQIIRRVRPFLLQKALLQLQTLLSSVFWAIAP